MGKKVVIRNLPPDIPEAVFSNSIKEWLNDVNYLRFVPGSISEGVIKHTRVYLNFTSEETLKKFIKVYNGWRFVKKNGESFHAIVEYASFQLIPLLTKVQDDKEGTIFENSAYIEFMRQLNGETMEAKTNVETEVKIDVSKTPLLEHLRLIKKNEPASTSAGKKKKKQKEKEKKQILKRPDNKTVGTSAAKDVAEKPKRPKKRGKLKPQK